MTTIAILISLLTTSMEVAIAVIIIIISMTTKTSTIVSPSLTAQHSANLVQLDRI